MITSYPPISSGPPLNFADCSPMPNNVENGYIHIDSIREDKYRSWYFSQMRREGDMPSITLINMNFWEWAGYYIVVYEDGSFKAFRWDDGVELEVVVE